MLENDSLLMFKKKDAKDFTQKVHLKGSRVFIEPGLENESGVRYSFCIIAKSWKKAGSAVLQEGKLFRLSADNKQVSLLRLSLEATEYAEAGAASDDSGGNCEMGRRPSTVM